MTSSAMLIAGKAPRSKGGAVFSGDVLGDRPKCPGRMMKYLAGSSGRPSPIHMSSPFGGAARKVGNKIALSLAAFSVPTVRYASFVLGTMTPEANVKS